MSSENIQSWPKGQNYATIKAQLLREGRLFEDPDFPAVERSLYRTKPVPASIQWKRPWEIIRGPRFIDDYATRFDLDQGELGDCWVIAAAATLAANHKKLLNNLIQPEGQTFTKGQYAGIFRFRFWRFGVWVEVVVDDRLPTKHGRLMFAHNRETPNEFWVPLLEKAYAKLHSCYEYIDGGNIQNAMVDFTGGISETYDLNKPSALPADFYSLLMDTFNMNTMMGSSINPSKVREEAVGNGLYRGHAYSVTDVRVVPTVDGRRHQLLRVRNPWGYGEWNGAWSDASGMWNQVSAQVKQQLNMRKLDDGEFWMNYEDWMENFDTCEMCHLTPNSMTAVIAEHEGKFQWNLASHDGAWVRGVTAGGCGNAPYQDMYWMNPQYLATLNSSHKCSDHQHPNMIISLMEMQMFGSHGSQIAVGFEVFEVTSRDANANNGNRRFGPQDMRSLMRSGSYTYYREVTKRVSTAPGNYIVMPSTFKPGEQAKFLLRIFSQGKPVPSKETDTPTGPTKELTAPEDDLWQIYQKNCGDDKRVDAWELRKILNEYMGLGNNVITLETSRSLLAMNDTNRNGTLDYKELTHCMEQVKTWTNAFSIFDRDKTNTIDIYELSKMFQYIKLNVSRKVLISIILRYGDRKYQLHLQDFIIAVSKVLAMYNTYRRLVPEGEQKASVTLDEWIAESLAM